MKTPTDIKPPPAPMRLLNVFLWQMAGLTIGGLLPIAAVLFAPEVEWLIAALILAPITAVFGACVGTAIGFYDR